MTKVIITKELEQLGARSQEALLDPKIARWWLEDTGRIVFQEDGSFQLGLDIDHVGLAGVAIMAGNEPRFLTEVYSEVMDGNPSANDNWIKGYVISIIERYNEHLGSDTTT